jgi:hypothetical protein
VRIVAALSTWIGCNPARLSNSSSRCRLTPGAAGVFRLASVPASTTTPASCRLRTVAMPLSGSAVVGAGSDLPSFSGLIAFHTPTQWRPHRRVTECVTVRLRASFRPGPSWAARSNEPVSYPVVRDCSQRMVLACSSIRRSDQL